eukprot:7384423-Prymnesium_polylepis.3
MTVLVVGASRGIGFEVAKRYLTVAPYNGVVHVTVRKQPDNVWYSTIGGGVDVRDRLHVHKLEVTDDPSVLDLARKLQVDGVTFNVLVHSAGINRGARGTAGHA